MRARPTADSSGSYPTVAQQHADALHQVLANGPGSTTTEVIFHVRGDGCTADDGTPVTDTAIVGLIDDAQLRAMIHDADRRPVNASGTQRHATTRQKRVVKERDRACVDCWPFGRVPRAGTRSSTLLVGTQLLAVEDVVDAFVDATVVHHEPSPEAVAATVMGWARG